MKDINLPPFYVGQRVVALVSVGQLVKSKVYIVLGLFKCVKCNVWYVQHSVSADTILNDIYPCCGSLISTKGYRAAMANKFAPIQENFQSITLKKVLELETEFISSS